MTAALTIENAAAYGRTIIGELIMANARRHVTDGVEFVSFDLNTRNGDACGTLDVWVCEFTGSLYGEF